MQDGSFLPKDRLHKTSYTLHVHQLRCHSPRPTVGKQWPLLQTKHHLISRYDPSKILHGEEMDELIGFFGKYGTLVVAALAFMVSVYNASATRRHNRLSVQPRLTAFTDSDEEHTQPGIFTYAVELKNRGLGPAFIRKFEVLVNGIPHEPMSHDEFQGLVCSNIAAQLAPSPFARYFAVQRPGFVMGKDEVQILIKIAFHHFPSDLKEQLKKFHLRITFESAYGVIDCYDTRRHEDLGSDLADAKFAVRFLCQALKRLAFNRLPVLRFFR